MPSVPFLIFNTALLALQGLVTLGVGAGRPVLGHIAGLVGVLFVLGIVQISHRFMTQWGFGVLAMGVSSVIAILNYGLFTLILIRNPMLTWSTVFLATSIAALLLGGIGYRRARKRLLSR